MQEVVWAALARAQHGVHLNFEELESLINDDDADGDNTASSLHLKSNNAEQKQEEEHAQVMREILQIIPAIETSCCH